VDLTLPVQRWIASETGPRNALRRATATFFLIEGPFFRVLGASPAGVPSDGFLRLRPHHVQPRTSGRAPYWARTATSDHPSAGGYVLPRPAGAASCSVQRRLM